MTVQIGAVILFGFLIVALSTYQAAVVPDQNREVEFLHNQEVQTDVVQVANSLSATGRTGSAAPQTVALGTRYPSRALFVNPPPRGGACTRIDPLATSPSRTSPSCGRTGRPTTRRPTTGTAPSSSTRRSSCTSPGTTSTATRRRRATSRGSCSTASRRTRR
ncbi:hypothetical protein ACFQRB_09430 [Halobaculum litoreum]|uniref:Uncharacterized protein n=1 Tax=Halobaculum litoreum TaxID=3031998 RepID=A0ABD5XNM4_9EURY